MSVPRERRWLRYAIGYFFLCQIQAVSVLDRILYGEWMGKPGDRLTQFLVITQMIIGAVLVYQGSRLWRSVRIGASIWLSLAAFLICTVAWSVSPGATIRAGAQYLSLIVAAIGVAETLDVDEFMDLLAWVCFLSAVASISLLIVWPAAAIGEFGDFRGIFSQKNPLGEAMSMGVLACLHGLLGEDTWP